MRSMPVRRKVYRKLQRQSDRLPRAASIAAGEQRLQDLLRDLPRQLRSDQRVEKLLVRALVLSFVLPLWGKPLATRIGMGLTYQKLFGQSLGTLAAMARTLRTGVLAETRRLLRMGSASYVDTALREIGDLFKEV